MANFLDTINQIASNVADKEAMTNKKMIDKSSFDKTYIGRVVDKEVVGGVITRWLVVAGGGSLYIDAVNTDIKSIGQKVRVYIPSNMQKKVYAEVISPATAPDKIVYKENDEKYDDYKDYGVGEKRNVITRKYDETTGEIISTKLENRDVQAEDIVIDSITETWNLVDASQLTRVYIATVINVDTDYEEVTNLICPDGKVINLEGFVIT